MKLLDVQIFPNGGNGWKSDLLTFGEGITQLYGPNGSGKTPLIQSIAFCLGHPCVFRNDIYERCGYTELRVETIIGTLKIKRVFSRDVDIFVTNESGEIQRFLNELEYSQFLFGVLGIEKSNLVTNGNKMGAAYLSSMLPIFYLDQDDGYQKLYSPPSNFIKDQFSEMMRMIFRLPTKHSFDAKKGKFRAKESLDFLDTQVEEMRRKVEVARENTVSTETSYDDIVEEIKVLESELDTLRSSGASHDDSISILDKLIGSQNRSIQNLDSEISGLNKRNFSIHQIVKEINTEIETLNLNEEARRVFLSFNEICGSSKCQLFSSSSDSYGKNLLYLKDQLKDLVRNAEIDRVKIEQLEIKKTVIETQVSELVNERNATLEKSDISSLIDAISAIKNRVFDLQFQKEDIEKIQLLEKKYVEVLSKRGFALDKYQSFSSTGVSNPDIIKLRADLRDKFLRWLDVLDTNNVSRDITFRDDFSPVLGTEVISQLKGSTRTRAVLAFHAALLELISSYEVDSFQFLILDTPKQHETHHCDLDQYIKELKKLTNSSGIQVIFSTTEYHYDGDEFDKEWVPVYPGKKQNMFLSELSS